MGITLFMDLLYYLRKFPLSGMSALETFHCVTTLDRIYMLFYWVRLQKCRLVDFSLTNKAVWYHQNQYFPWIALPARMLWTINCKTGFLDFFFFFFFLIQCWFLTFLMSLTVCKKAFVAVSLIPKPWKCGNISSRNNWSYPTYEFYEIKLVADEIPFL